MNKKEIKFKETEIGEIPEDWEVEELQKISKVIDSCHKTPKYSPEGIAMVRVTDIKYGDIDLKDTLKVTKEVYEEFTLNHKPKKNDIVIAFSGSGTSKNVVKALKLARNSEAFSIGFTGKSGGEFPNLCDICVKVQSTDMLTIESFHVMLCHIITSGIRQTGTPEFSYE